MRKVHVKVTLDVLVAVNENANVLNLVREIDFYSAKNDSDEMDVIDMIVTDATVTDSR